MKQLTAIKMFIFVSLINFSFNLLPVPFSYVSVKFYARGDQTDLVNAGLMSEKIESTKDVYFTTRGMMLDIGYSNREFMNVNSFNHKDYFTVLIRKLLIDAFFLINLTILFWGQRFYLEDKIILARSFYTFGMIISLSYLIFGLSEALDANRFFFSYTKQYFSNLEIQPDFEHYYVRGYIHIFSTALFAILAFLPNKLRGRFLA